MNETQALALVDDILTTPLTDIQEIVFIQIWRGKTYADIAQSYSYDHNHIRDVGAKLLQKLSKALDQKVTKSNIHSILRRYVVFSSSHRLQSNLSPIDPSLDHSLVYPSGPVPLDSPLYIERPPVEKETFMEISKPGSLVRIKGGLQMGKTSLMYRVLAQARQHIGQVVSINIQRADQEVFSSLDRFLRWFSANVNRQLNLNQPLDQIWDKEIGSKVSCTLYFQERVLPQIEGALVLALDEVNRLFEFPEIYQDFLPLLRSWYEESSEGGIWSRLRLMILYASEAYVPLRLHQSPFNVGLLWALPEFSFSQIQDLALRHGLRQEEDLLPLLEMVGGHPALIRLAFYRLARREIIGSQLLEEAPTLSGIFRSHLQRILILLRAYPDLAVAFSDVLACPQGYQLEPLVAYRLESMGLIYLQGNLAVPRCQLYRHFFKSQWIEGGSK